MQGFAEGPVKERAWENRHGLAVEARDGAYAGPSVRHSAGR